jgi:hypothetical protein
MGSIVPHDMDVWVCHMGLLTKIVPWFDCSAVMGVLHIPSFTAPQLLPQLVFCPPLQMLALQKPLTSRDSAAHQQHNQHLLPCVFQIPLQNQHCIRKPEAPVQRLHCSTLHPMGRM